MASAAGGAEGEGRRGRVRPGRRLHPGRAPRPWRRRAATEAGPPPAPGREEFPDGPYGMPAPAGEDGDPPAGPAGSAGEG
ncbi:MAG: hypothetical protein K6V73_07765 [Firmicutes bacterium]|nr:hypothetical protein [Bacillota bacterium]